MCRALRAWALPLVRPLGARACGGGGSISYTQGQSPEPRTREYFYYVDHQGQVGQGRGRGGSLQERAAGGVGRVSKVSELDSAELEQRTRETGAPSPSSAQSPALRIPRSLPTLLPPAPPSWETLAGATTITPRKQV